MKKLLLIFFFFASCYNLYAQDRVLKGKVVSSTDGGPLPGVIVSIKGTKKQAASGPDGLFSITIPNGAATLQIRSIGYQTKEIPVNEVTANLNISMVEDNQQLGEVVVTGYSNQKKSDLTSAITVVSADKLKDVTSNDVGAMLQGKVAGLQVVNASGVPGAASEIRLRGISSVNASQSPLFVVDGVIGGNYDPNDVESITDLKDAGATAIYGSQANAGVIIVTTKKAKDDQTHFEFKSNGGVRTPDFGSMTMMNSSEL